MKKIIFLTSAIILSGCQSPNVEAAKPMEQQPNIGGPIVGGDSDAHGCKASAGYTWSNTRNTCVRVWEVGIRLKPVNTSSTYDYIIIRNGNDGPIEVFGEGFNATVFNGKNPMWYDDNKQHIIRIMTPITGKQVLVLCKIEANGNEVAIAQTELD